MGLFSVSGYRTSHQTMLRAIRCTKLRAPASVFNPRVRRARGLKRPNLPSNRLVKAGTLGFPWLRTGSCQRSTRCHSSLRTSVRRRTRPCIVAFQSAGRTGPAFGGRPATPTPSRPGIGSPHDPDAGPRVPRLALPVSLGSGRRPPRTGATPGNPPGPGSPPSVAATGPPPTVAATDGSACASVKPKTVCRSLSLADELVDTPLVPEEDRQESLR